MGKRKVCVVCDKQEVEEPWTICPSCLEWNLFEIFRRFSDLECELRESEKRLKRALRDVVER
jgi:hypothetical protein